MSRRPRRNHAAVFKAKVVLAALKGEKTLSELAEQFDIHANQITQWKSQLLEGAAVVFGEAKEQESSEVDKTKLHAKIGELSLERDLFRKRALESGSPERKEMIDSESNLSIYKQSKLLKISRSSA
jgi:transposase-like protein